MNNPFAQPGHSQMNHVNIKVYYDNQPDIRRIRVAVPELKLENLKQRVVRESQDIRVAYKDNEGDWITINSDDELQDAVFLYKDDNDPVFRVKVFHNNASETNRDGPSNKPIQFPNLNDLPREFEQLAGTLTAALSDFQDSARQNPILTDFIKTFQSSLNSQCRQQPEQSQREQPQTTEQAHQSNEQPRTRGKHCPSRARNHHGGMHCHFRNRNRRQQQRCPMNGDMSTAYKAAAVHMLIHKAVKFMDQGKLNEAEAELLKARDVNPNARLVYYNLGCIESIRGNLENAIAHLESAVDCGYTNVDWMLKDNDLANVRPLRAFHELVARAYTKNNETTTQSETQTQPAQGADASVQSSSSEQASAQTEENGAQTEAQQEEEEEAAEEPVPSAPTQIEEPEMQENQQQQKWHVQLGLLHEMGLTDDAQNVALLERWNGNMARVINDAFNN